MATKTVRILVEQRRTSVSEDGAVSMETWHSGQEVEVDYALAETLLKGRQAELVAAKKPSSSSTKPKPKNGIR